MYLNAQQQDVVTAHTRNIFVFTCVHVCIFTYQCLCLYVYTYTHIGRNRLVSLGTEDTYLCRCYCIRVGTNIMYMHNNVQSRRGMHTFYKTLKRCNANRFRPDTYRCVHTHIHAKSTRCHTHTHTHTHACIYTSCNTAFTQLPHTHIQVHTHANTHT